MKSWYSLNIYPATKKGRFTAVLLENKGYHLPCQFHRTSRCKKCVSFKTSHQMGVVYQDEPMDGATPADLMAKALNLFLASGYRYDPATNQFVPD